MEIATEIALEIRAKIKQVTGLNASAGMAAQVKADLWVKTDRESRAARLR